MWWSAIEEDLPLAGSRIDIAYSLRASTYRGRRQAAARFIAFRLIEKPAPVEVLSLSIETVDLRASAQPAVELARLRRPTPIFWSGRKGWTGNMAKADTT